MAYVQSYTAYLQYMEISRLGPTLGIFDEFPVIWFWQP
jgi:hypothetical protein